MYSKKTYENYQVHQRGCASKISGSHNALDCHSAGRGTWTSSSAAHREHAGEKTRSYKTKQYYIHLYLQLSRPFKTYIYMSYNSYIMKLAFMRYKWLCAQQFLGFISFILSLGVSFREAANAHRSSPVRSFQ